jgi:hypothetical protein
MGKQTGGKVPDRRKQGKAPKTQKTSTQSQRTTSLLTVPCFNPRDNDINIDTAAALPKRKRDTARFASRSLVSEELPKKAIQFAFFYRHVIRHDG